jgi:hypothetical protein
MKSREEMAWEIFLKMLENPVILHELRFAEVPSECAREVFSFAYSTAYDYNRFINGDLQ